MCEDPQKTSQRKQNPRYQTNLMRTCVSATWVGVVKLHAANQQRRPRTPLSTDVPTSVRADANHINPLTGRSPTRRASAPCPPVRSPAHISGQ